MLIEKDILIEIVSYKYFKFPKLRSYYSPYFVIIVFYLVSIILFFTY